MNLTIYILLLLEASFSFYLCFRTKYLDSYFKILITSLFIAAAFSLRFLALDHVTADYTDFLSIWVNWFRENSGFKALKYSVGNYNIPYLYFLALFSYLKINDLYLIKILSIAFDILLAWSVSEIVGFFKKDSLYKLVSFLSVLLYPTVILNGAYWAQCDSIYTFFALSAFYFALSNRTKLSMIFLALSFGFKLQAVFFMPVYALFLMYRKIPLKDLIFFPLTYFILILPVIILGRPLTDTITLYFNQIDSVGTGLNYNSPSVFAFWDHKSIGLSYDEISKFAICCSFTFALLIILTGFLKKQKSNNVSILLAAVLFSIGIPFLLPRMHDRYFFQADILTLTLANIFPRMIPIAVLTEFSSFLGYYAYLKGRYLLLMKYGTIALAISICLLLIEYFKSFSNILEF